jgi:hypothetical protein
VALFPFPILESHWIEVDSVDLLNNVFPYKSCMGEKRNSYRILVGKPEGKRPLERPRRSWVNDIKMDRREIGWNGVDWIDLAQDMDQWKALVNTVMKLRVSQNGGKFFSGCTICGFSRRAQLNE